MKEMEKQKGITLVALTITIILLLILSGITISSLTRSGLFENTKLAAQKSKEAQEKEDGILGDYEDKINGYLSNSREVTEEDLNSMFYPNKSMALNLSNNEVTIGRNGWLYIYFSKIAHGDYFYAARNGNTIFGTSDPTENCADSAYIPVKKGDVISVSNSAYFKLTLMYYEKE